MTVESKNLQDHILIVDDDPTCLNILSDTLMREGYNVAIANGGDRAMRLIERKSPDLILLDVQMPEIDGFTVCQKLKLDPKTAQIPIFFMTALTDLDSKIKGFEVGALDFISKPFQEQELLVRIKTHLQVMRLAKQLEQEVNSQKEARLQIESQLTELQEKDKRIHLQNEQLNRVNLELVQTSRLKDEFLANMSHEFKTPLNAILGMTEGLKEGVFGAICEQQVKVLESVEKNGYHLLELIGDILDLSKIEAGLHELDLIPTPILHLCQSSLAFIKKQALQKQIQLDFNAQRNLPELLVDTRLMRQAIIHLLNNAVKFTPVGGHITLEVTHISPDIADSNFRSQHFMRIAVFDTGIGIAPEDAEKLFQPFVQLQGGFNRKHEGTGLGLALVKRITELHGGRVGLTSEVGVGSCFTIDLPCSPISTSVHEIKVGNMPTATESHITTPVVRQAPTILLADDNDANITTFSCYLGTKGYRVLLAKDGQEALDLTKEYHPDLILMDIQMPRINGLEVIELIRSDLSQLDIPIIAITAFSTIADREKCLKAGATDFLLKPVKLQHLATTIQQILAGKESV